MPAPRQRHLLSLSPHGFHRVAYREWGDPRNSRVVVCLHGLTRNGRDFDFLAEAIADRYRVLCPDMPGRGDSEWLRDPADYTFPTYLTTLTALLAQAEAERVAWVGTSMGGLLGMVLASQAGTPVVRLVCNDVGPVIERTALDRIARYVGADPVFENFAGLDAHIREVSAPFGNLSDEQWFSLSHSTARQMPDATWRLKYDPGIAVPFRDAASQTADLWPLWDAVRCPTLVLRGVHSDLLSQATADAMTSRGPRASLVSVPGVGHAPPLLSTDQIGPVIGFLDDM